MIQNCRGTTQSFCVVELFYFFKNVLKKFTVKRDFVVMVDRSPRETHRGQTKRASCLFDLG